MFHRIQQLPPSEASERRTPRYERPDTPYRQQLRRRTPPPSGGGGALWMAVLGVGVLVLWLRFSGLPSNPADRIIIFAMLGVVVVALVQILARSRPGDD